jgi:molybdate transport system substrate-binding protein
VIVVLPRRHPVLVLAVISIVAVTGLGAALVLSDWGKPEGQSENRLIVQCAASQRVPVAEIADAYQTKFGVPVEVRYGASDALLSAVQMTGQGDVFLPADESYVIEAQRLDLVSETFPITRMHAVLAVAAGNPKAIRTWSELTSGKIRIAQANTAAAIGKMTRDHLAKIGQWNDLKSKTTVELGTVTDVANAVKLKSVDAGIVWDAVARPMSEVEMIELPELSGIEARVVVAIMKRSSRVDEASRFAFYLASPETGLPHFLAHGFQAVEAGARSAPRR